VAHTQEIGSAPRLPTGSFPRRRESSTGYQAPGSVETAHLDSRLRGNDPVEGMPSGGSLEQRWIEIVPFGVHLFYEAQLPRPVPLLDPLLAEDGRLWISMRLIPDKMVHAVT